MSKEELMTPLVDRNTGVIKNISELLQMIKSDNDAEFLKSYLDELIIFKKNNKLDEISSLALKTALEERINAIEKEMKSNRGILKSFSNYNEGFKMVTIVTGNDGTEYFRFEKDGNIRLLRCSSDTMLLDYINEHPNFKKNGYFESFCRDNANLICDVDVLNKKIIEEKIMEEEPKVIGYNAFINLLSDLYKGTKISDEDTKKMHVFTKVYLEQMKNGTIDYDHQNALDCYMEYLREKLGGKSEHVIGR